MSITPEKPMTMNFSLPRAVLTAAVSAMLCFAPVTGFSISSAYAQDATSSSEAAAPTDEQIKAGLAVWKDRGGCFNCHGDFGQGGEGGHFPAGPSLRKSATDLETMQLIISCGLPGTKMPFNLEGAYKTEECYGTIGEEPPPEVVPGTALSKQEITDLVAYLGARVHGQRRITKDQCIEYFDDANAPECAAYR
jgi:mono/diheme cytochrome c family protein